MNIFWMSNDTVKALYGQTYKAFKLFGPTHLFWLGLTLLLVILTFVFFPKLTKEQQKKCYIVITILLLVDELFKDIPLLITGQFMWKYLPFHLCSVNIFICLINTIKENDLCKSILTCACIPAALCALLFPNWTCLPIANFMHIHSETVHIMLVLYPVMLLSTGYRPKYKQLPYMYAYVICLACFDKILNNLLGTNFMFLNNNENNVALILAESVFGKFYDFGVVGANILLTTIFMVIYNVLKKK